MKNILYIFSLFCTVSCTNFNSPNEVNISLIESGAEVTVLEGETIYFGEITEGEKIDLEFKIQNSGTGNLIITKATASCGCTQLEYPKEIIKQGVTEVIKVTFDSEGKLGKQTKKITLLTNATPSIKILTIKGEVVPFQN